MAERGEWDKPWEAAHPAATALSTINDRHPVKGGSGIGFLSAQTHLTERAGRAALGSASAGLDHCVG